MSRKLSTMQSDGAAMAPTAVDRWAREQQRGPTEGPRRERVPTVSEHLGRRFGEIRRAAGRRQDDAARVAQMLGTGWSRSSIATFEAGDRELSAEELGLLPAIASEVAGREVTMEELVGPHQWLRLSPAAVIHGSYLLPTWGGREIDPEHGPKVLPASTLMLNARERNADERAPVPDEVWGRIVALGLDQAWRQYDGYFAEGDTEIRMARKLGEPPLLISVLAFALWDRPLTVRRDELVAARGDTLDDQHRLTALRGRASRQLQQELAAEIQRRTGAEGERQAEA